MSNAVLDQSTDLNGQEIFRIVNLYEAPSFVKRASNDDVCGDETTGQHLYADTTRRRFPCHTPAAVWMSAAFFAEKQAELNPRAASGIEQRIRKSAAYFNISTQVDALMAKIAEDGNNSESQLDDSVFAIVRRYPGGRQERKYPMRNAGEVKQAADYLVNYRDHFTYADRQVIADKVLQKAAQFGANVAEHRNMLERTSGLGGCASKDAAALVRSRIPRIRQTDKGIQMRAELEKLASMIEKRPGELHHYTPMVKLATIIDDVDREHSLVKFYDKSLERPEDVLFGVTEKVAMEVTSEIAGSELTGNFYKLADLEGLPLNTLGDHLGDDFAQAVSLAGLRVDREKMAAILPTLPRSDAEAFDALLSEMGVSPFATKSASIGERITPTEMTKLAADHDPNHGSLWDHIPS